MGQTAPGNRYLIDLAQPPGAVAMAASNLGNLSVGIAFGTKLWTTSPATGSVSIITPQASTPYGTNIWVPNSAGNSITVFQASSGNVVATITADATNHLSHPASATFDGERILVTNQIGNSVTVFKAADLSVITNVTTGASTQPKFVQRRDQLLGAAEQRQSARHCARGGTFWRQEADGRSCAIRPCK